MNAVKKTVSSIIDNEYKSYAMYTISNRAIPSYVDGFKNVHRKILYSMLNYYKGKKVKVAELGTSISQFNYHHGETSAQGAVVTLSADWNNNMPIFRSHGNFGSRLIQEAAAPRYIYVDLNPNFHKYFNDFDVCNSHPDIDNPEPLQYLPVVPWVLVNGIEGIAVGFACKFLTHTPKDLAKACNLAIKNKLKDDYIIPVTLPGFKGNIIQVEHNKIITQGLVERTKRNTWTITEVPWGYDREKYFVVLTKLLDTNKITDFEDMCDESGFKFIIKMDTNADTLCEKDPIEFFKLEKPITENYTALDEKGSLVIFDNKLDIIRRFVDFRISKVDERLKNDVVKLNNSLDWLELKLKFIRRVVNKQINLLEYTRLSLISECMNTYNIDKEIASRLLSIPVYDMTIDVIDELSIKIEKTKDEINTISSLDAKTVYLDMLKAV